jgi:hypothetical protein
LLSFIPGGSSTTDGAPSLSPRQAPSIGDRVRVFDIIDSYMQREATAQVSDHRSKAARWKEYLGDVPLSSVTFELLESC